MPCATAPLTTEPSASQDFHLVPDARSGPLLKTQPAPGPPYRIFALTPLSAYLVTYRDGVKGIKVMSQGIIDLKNRNSLYLPDPLVPGETVTITWEMSALDRTVPAGQRIALILLGDNYGSDTVPVPVVGGHSAITL
ncbi:CocE/NonD family hydrolase C-terminal non-catalytic domain-containing protein [Lentzea sp.]|uniref:CocE/NonD family hydrolase C-terminal non-catalytic domain-containing protein n=1 Tax=Lentzea sp. TaxID=56099 RepID=UPI002BA2DF23|nr:CocE/NonD family hydrolase C-terminal non-catalytic domain-containing protein [Lentzea sp.]HUQ56380.1 CocE/NonD family hydrolase C-terminal non-catalytic domain-containing protein [Lentzea sp.]